MIVSFIELDFIKMVDISLCIFEIAKGDTENKILSGVFIKLFTVSKLMVCPVDNLLSIKPDNLMVGVCSFHRKLSATMDLPLNLILSIFKILSIVVFVSKFCFNRTIVFWSISCVDICSVSDRLIVFDTRVVCAVSCCFGISCVLIPT